MEEFSDEIKILEHSLLDTFMQYLTLTGKPALKFDIFASLPDRFIKIEITERKNIKKN